MKAGSASLLRREAAAQESAAAARTAGLPKLKPRRTSGKLSPVFVTERRKRAANATSLAPSRSVSGDLSVPGGAPFRVGHWRQ
eukprot:3060588-Prymnesium_polylepis.1